MSTDANKGATAPAWLTVAAAAPILDYEPVSLRRLLDRHARRTADGGVEAVVDGVVGRKIGRSWRVQLSAAWLEKR